jgi:hypothetical protein
VLGTVLASVYRSHLHLAGLPAAAAAAVKSGAGGGVAVAHAIGSATLLDGVRVAYVHGLDVMLWICAAIAAAAALLALAFLPSQANASGLDGKTGWADRGERTDEGDLATPAARVSLATQVSPAANGPDQRNAGAAAAADGTAGGKLPA